MYLYVLTVAIHLFAWGYVYGHWLYTTLSFEYIRTHATSFKITSTLLPALIPSS